MFRLTLISLLGAAVAAFAAAQLGGALGGGVLVGYFAGAGMTGLGCLYQRHVLLTHPSKSMAAFALAFLAKLVVVLMGGVALRYIESAGARADWQSFLVAFSAAVALIVPFGAMDAARAVVSTKNSKKSGSVPIKQAGV